MVVVVSDRVKRHRVDEVLDMRSVIVQELRLVVIAQIEQAGCYHIVTHSHAVVYLLIRNGRRPAVTSDILCIDIPVDVKFGEQRVYHPAGRFTIRIFGDFRRTVITYF